MKKWCIGVDGGGTKTAFAVSSGNGIPIAETRLSGCSYQAIGVEKAVEIIVEGVLSCLNEVGITLDDCAGCCLGVPCYGENTEYDHIIVETLQKRLSPVPIYVVNDVEVGWAGALECQPGIHIVAGTGSIAYGKGADGRSARCGGWNEFFGDEGSCYWLGREAMSLFTKQSDGRIPQGPLYELVKTSLHLSEDINFIDLVVNELAPYRDQVAAFQLYAYKAAQAGDLTARNLYERAAHELALMVGSLCRELKLPENTNVSYSGGLFQTGDLILKPLKKEIAAYHCNLQSPKGSAIHGALLLAIERFL